MAKQTGLYGIRGKVGEYKYYGMKGVDGTIMAKQNEGMSERVKTAPEYDNTRRNNFEFGMATSTAGAITKAFSQKWRYLLVPFATAKIAKAVLAMAKISSNLGWGNRAADEASLRINLPSSMQSLVKNDIGDFSPLNAVIATVEDDITVTISGEDVKNEKAMAAGCDGVRIVLVKSVVTAANGGYSAKTVLRASCENKELAVADVAFGDDANVVGTHPADEDATIYSIVLLPYRTIGDEKYIMQEFCSAKFFPAE